MDNLRKLPHEIKIKIINMLNGICSQCTIKKKTYPITKCSFCNNLLCNKHAQIAFNYGKQYRFYDCFMCDNCCWWEIS